MLNFKTHAINIALFSVVISTASFAANNDELYRTGKVNDNLMSCEAVGEGIGAFALSGTRCVLKEDIRKVIKDGIVYVLPEYSGFTNELEHITSLNGEGTSLLVQHYLNEYGQSIAYNLIANTLTTQTINFGLGMLGSALLAKAGKEFDNRLSQEQKVSLDKSLRNIADMLPINLVVAACQYYQEGTRDLIGSTLWLTTQMDLEAQSPLGKSLGNGVQKILEKTGKIFSGLIVSMGARAYLRIELDVISAVVVHGGATVFNLACFVFKESDEKFLNTTHFGILPYEYFRKTMLENPYTSFISLGIMGAFAISTAKKENTDKIKEIFGNVGKKIGNELGDAMDKFFAPTLKYSEQHVRNTLAIFGVHEPVEITYTLTNVVMDTTKAVFENTCDATTGLVKGGYNAGKGLFNFTYRRLFGRNSEHQA